MNIITNELHSGEPLFLRSRKIVIDFNIHLVYLTVLPTTVYTASNDRMANEK
jgi:hypothetical protein